MTDINLWLGIEDYNWTVDDFTPFINFCKAHKLDGCFVKVFDGMQGEWYNGQFPNIEAAFHKAGITCIPYGFQYGNGKGSSLSGEADLGLQFLSTYGLYCADMESSWDGQGDWAAQLAAIWKDHPGELYVTTWANVGDEAGGHRWLTAIGDLDPLVAGWIPQDYATNLYGLALQDWPKTQAPICPAFDLSQEDGPNDAVSLAQKAIAAHPPMISMWEWTYANAHPQLVDDIVAVVKGNTPVTNLLLSPAGAVCDVAQSNQLVDAQDSQEKCGPAATGALKYAGLPGKGPSGTAADIEAWEDAEYTKYIGPNVASDPNGSTIENMHQFLHDAGNLHYWDIAAIGATSSGASDLAHIKAALAAGYPVLATVAEQSVISRHLGHCPYPWQPRLGNVNHIFPIIGVASDGNLICADQLNAFEPWPQVYMAGSLNISWATVVQLVGPDANNSWLAPIPSSDPTSWPAGFNAQLFAGKQPVLPPPPQPPPSPGTDNVLAAANDSWGSFAVEVANALIKAGLPLPNTEAMIPPTGTGIYNAWLTDYKAGKFHGPVTSFERQGKDWNGNPIVIQDFRSGTYTFDTSAHWHGDS